MVVKFWNSKLVRAFEEVPSCAPPPTNAFKTSIFALKLSEALVMVCRSN